MAAEDFAHIHDDKVMTKNIQGEILSPYLLHQPLVPLLDRETILSGGYICKEGPATHEYGHQVV